jgi:CHAT domain-containing protein
MAAHSLFNERNLLRGGFLITPTESGQEGLLSLKDLQAADFRAVRIVVLASCSSGMAPTGREGSLSIARLFQLVGVPTVIASMWDVSDSCASELLEKFHWKYSRGSSPSSALREAQLAYKAAKGRDDLTWGAFQVFDTSSSF